MYCNVEHPMKASELNRADTFDKHEKEEEKWMLFPIVIKLNDQIDSIYVTSHEILLYKNNRTDGC